MSVPSKIGGYRGGGDDPLHDVYMKAEYLKRKIERRQVSSWPRLTRPDCQTKARSNGRRDVKERSIVR